MSSIFEFQEALKKKLKLKDKKPKSTEEEEKEAKKKALMELSKKWSK